MVKKIIKIKNKNVDDEMEIITNGMVILNINEDYIIKIQRWFRKNMLKRKRLPSIMYRIKDYLTSLKSSDFSFSKNNSDGRINSCIDEDNIINLLSKKFTFRIKKPKIRMWYDILVYDYEYNWIPINIKTTTTLTYDNTGNLAMCVYAYTNEKLNIHRSNTYENGKMSDILINKLNNKEYNYDYKKDYYFLVMNKTNNKDIIINSVKGLSILTPNINNLPFQICWNKNRNFEYKDIGTKVRLFIKCLQKPKPSWKEIFMTSLRKLKTI